MSTRPLQTFWFKREMADMKSLDFNIIIKNPVLLKVGDAGNDFRSGVSVIDIIFPGNNNVEVRL